MTSHTGFLSLPIAAFVAVLFYKVNAAILNRRGYKGSSEAVIRDRKLILILIFFWCASIIIVTLVNTPYNEISVIVYASAIWAIAKNRLLVAEKAYSFLKLRTNMTSNTSPLRVFLCHSSGDKQIVRDLYHQLRNEGFDPWIDEENILPGQNWQEEITKAVRRSDVVVICLSHGAIMKAGFVQKEIKFALDVADEQPEDTIFLIPLRLEKCEVPQRLRKWQWIDLFDSKGYEKLTRSLLLRAGSLHSRGNAAEQLGPERG